MSSRVQVGMTQRRGADSFDAFSDSKAPDPFSPEEEREKPSLSPFPSLKVRKPEERAKEIRRPPQGHDSESGPPGR